MTAQMNISYRTVTEDRPTTTTVRTTAPVNSKPDRPETPNGRRGPRWLGPLVAIGAVVAVGAVLVVDANSDPSPAPSTELAATEATRTYWETRSFPTADAAPSARELIDQSIADALPVQNAADAATNAPTGTPGATNDPFRVPERVSATVATPTVLDRSIAATDHASSQANVSAPTDSFATAEANRMNTLRDLSGTSRYTPECGIVGPC